MSQEKSINWDAAAELVEIEGNPVPARGQAGYIRARDGKLLRNAVFSPDAPAKGTIVLMTGYSEFIEKYFETIADLTARGYCVAALEWRGHGLSEGNSKEPTRLHLSDFDQNIEDMEDRFDRLVRAHCPPPYFGLAHSMGGQISAHGAAPCRLAVGAGAISAHAGRGLAALAQFYSGGCHAAAYCR